MWKLLIKKQINSGVFVIPLLFIIFEFYLGSGFVIFIFLQERFTNVFKNSDFPLLLAVTTGSNLNKLFIAYFLSWLVWFNLWFFSLLIFEAMDFSVFIQRILKYNMLFCISFTLGLYINNSKNLSIQNPFLLRLVTYTLFTFSITSIYLLLVLNNYFINKILLDVLLFAVTLFASYFLIRNQREVHYKENYILP